MSVLEPVLREGSVLGDGRYLLQGTLGAGSMGEVHAAHDRELGRDVALKILRGRGADQVYQLKQEFRALADLRHPNLVVLHDLTVEASRAFFTMELLDAQDFVTYVRGAVTPGSPGPNGWARVYETLPQLLAGLEALHAAGRVHRDIKPSNVLVTREGRVVLIDFGLAALGERFSPRRETGSLSGTMPYIAPEIRAGEPPSPAADAFALGVTLFEALTGELPPEGKSLGRLPPGTRMGSVPSVRKRVPETPPDLAGLTDALRDPEPARRPIPAEIRLEPAASRDADQAPLMPSRASLWTAPFVDRAESLVTLHGALGEAASGRVAIVRIEGASGIGKSALVRHFLDQVEQSPRIVLASRCYPQESVPFKALDGLIDSMSDHLARLAPAEIFDLSSDAVAALVQVFPVLGRVPGLERVAPGRVGPAEPEETRRIAFQALRTLLAVLARRALLIVWIDDLQWGDADSVVFLRTLAEPDGLPGALILLSYRDADWESGGVLARLHDDDGSPIGRGLSLDALPEKESRSLVATLLAGRVADASEQIGAIARESGGNPFLACELTRHRLASHEGASGNVVKSSGKALGIPDIVASRFRALDESARRLISVVAVAGRPCEREVARRAAGLDRGLEAAVAALRNECLLRDSSGGGRVRYEAFHDRIREAIVSLLGPDRRREIHLGLAAALEQTAGMDPIELVQHYHGAGENERAAHMAVAAAQRAFGALAFEQSARLYEFVLEIGAGGVERWRLLRGRAEALAQAGRSGDAGFVYRQAAQALSEVDPTNPCLQELVRDAAEQFLRGGHIEEGTTALREALESVGERYPRTPLRAFWKLAYHRAVLMVRGLGYVKRAEAEIEPARLRRMDALWGAAVGLVWADSIRSAAFHGRHTRLALAAGEPGRIVRALCTEAVFHAALATPWAKRRADAALAAARRLSAEMNSPLAAALLTVCEGGTAYFLGQFPEGYEKSLAAEEMLRTRCSGVAWERTNAHIFSCWSLSHMGDLEKLREVVPELLRRARKRNDLLEVCCLLGGIPTSMDLLADDRPSEVRSAVQETSSRWPTPDFQLPAYFGLVSATLADLYTGQALAAWRRLQGAWPTLRAVRLLDFRLVRVEFHQLLTRCAIAASNARGSYSSTSPPSRRFIRRQITRIEHESMPWARPFAAALRASLAAFDGDPDRHERELAIAVEGFEAASMGLWAAAARHQAGSAHGTQWMRERGVRKPDLFAEMLIPGGLRARTRTVPATGAPSPPIP